MSPLLLLVFTFLAVVLAIAGTYQVRLTIDGHRLEAPLVVRPDPRVATSAGALEQQFQLASNLARALSESSRAL